MQLDLESHKSLEDLRGFLAGSRDESVLVPGRKAAYAQIGKVLRRFSYWKLGRADKGLVRRYLQRTTGLSRAQLTRLVGRYLRKGELRDRLLQVDGVDSVRGRGLLLAAELSEEARAGRSAKDVASACLDQGLVVNGVTPTALRLAPPFVVSTEQLAEGCSILAGVLEQR